MDGRITRIIYTNYMKTPEQRMREREERLQVFLEKVKNQVEDQTQS